MSVVAWIVLGLIAGFIASKIANRAGSGIIGDIVLGILGALTGGFIFERLWGMGITTFNVWSIIVAAIGAIVLLFAVNLFRRRD